MFARCSAVAVAVALVISSMTSFAVADEAAPGAPTGAPPPEAKALAAGPKAPGEAPAFEKNPDDGTTGTLSAGGMQTTGNSRTLAVTASGALESRFDRNGVGASLLANYGQGAAPGNAVVATAENVQGRLRYDRYVIDEASLFLIGTGRHDRFQGLDFRLNVDPGVKYLFVKDTAKALWAELGYDFQYDVRRDDARVQVDANDVPLRDANGQPLLLDKTAVDHSARVFAGYRHAFNKEVTFSTGLEYLQSVVETTRWRMNFDALLAAKIMGGLAFGFGFNARYDHAPLPSKKELDTSMNASLIWAFSDVAEKKEKTCPCPEEPPPEPPPEAAPPTTPAPAPPPTPGE